MLLKKVIWGSIAALFCITTTMSKKLVVTVPVADLRITPSATPAEKAPALSEDMGGRATGQITQLLFNEMLEADKEQAPNGWLKVTALEQFNAFGEAIPSGYVQTEQVAEVETFTNNTLIVKSMEVVIEATHADHQDDKKTVVLPLGTYLNGIECSSVNGEKTQWLVSLPQNYLGMIYADDVHEIAALSVFTAQQQREALIASAQLFLTTKFVWGGRSVNAPSITNQITGVDISGFINLVFRTIHINVPKTSKHIFMAAQMGPIPNGTTIQPGDIIFLVQPSKGFTTPLLYLGNNEVIYATGNPSGKDYSSVHEYSLEEQKKLCVSCAPLTHFFTTPLANLNNGDIPTWVDKKRFEQGARVYFGSFIPTN